MLKILLVFMLAIGLTLFVYGIKKKSGLTILFGNFFWMTAVFYALHWNSVVMFVPPIALIITYVITKKPLFRQSDR